MAAHLPTIEVIHKNRQHNFYIYFKQHSNTEAETMCIVTYFKHLTCDHIWAVVTEPCLPYMGFTNCPTFSGGSVAVSPATGKHVGNIRGGRLKAKPKFYKTKTRLCLKCDLQGAYDPNVARLVTDMGWGLTWGKDASDPEGYWGVDFRLGSVKNGCVIL